MRDEDRFEKAELLMSDILTLAARRNATVIVMVEHEGERKAIFKGHPDVMTELINKAQRVVSKSVEEHQANCPQCKEGKTHETEESQTQTEIN